MAVVAWVMINGAGIEKDPAAPIEVLNIERINTTYMGLNYQSVIQAQSHSRYLK